MDQVVKYIKKELGINIELSPVERNHSLPTFLTSLYCLYKGKIYEQSVVFAQYMSDSILAPSNYPKHEKMLKQVFAVPVIFVFNQIQSYNKKRLSSLGVNFIVLDSQIYLPELLIVLSKPPKTKRIDADKPLTPTAQVVLLYYFYGNDNIFSYKQLQEALGMPYPTVCRAIEVLTVSKLCRVVGLREKTIQFDDDKVELFNKALPLMKSPVKKVLFAEKGPELAYKTGITALSEYTMINPDEYEHLAISYEESKQLKNYSTEDHYLPMHIEVWGYNPALFAKEGVVDKISLYLSMKDNQDERIQYELNQMIQKIW